ncbi:hydroxymyristoyl-ACP dehydratase [Clostridiaceae bacterium 35-E11]
MMNINCSLNCFFQNDGRCELTHVTALSSTPHPSCVYFTPKQQTYTSFSTQLIDDPKDVDK